MPSNGYDTPSFVDVGLRTIEPALHILGNFLHRSTLACGPVFGAHFTLEIVNRNGKLSPLTELRPALRAKQAGPTW